MSPETTTVHDETLYGGDDVDSCGNLNEDDADATERAVPVVGTTTTQLAAAQERQTLARKETRVVRTLRIVVLAVLWSTGALMAWATFAYTRRIEQDDFEASFAAASTAVLESFHEAMNQNFGSIDALSAAVTDHARSTHQIFPNVTFPGFHALAAATRVMTHAIYVFYIPIVTDDTRRSYEAYCREHQGYLFPAFSEQQTLVALQDERFGLEPAPLPGQRRLHFNLHEPHPTIHDEIFGSEVRDPSSYWEECTMMLVVCVCACVFGNVYSHMPRWLYFTIPIQHREEVPFVRKTVVRTFPSGNPVPLCHPTCRTIWIWVPFPPGIPKSNRRPPRARPSWG